MNLAFPVGLDTPVRHCMSAGHFQPDFICLATFIRIYFISGSTRFFLI